MIQPFNSKQIRRYLLAYAGVVVLMGIFYLIVSNFYEVQAQETKEFSTTPMPSILEDRAEVTQEEAPSPKNTIRLLPPRQ